MLTIVTEAVPVGRSKTVLSTALRRAGADQDRVRWAVLGDDLPQGDPVVAMTSYDNAVFRHITGSHVPIVKARGYRFESLEGHVVVPTFDPRIVAFGKMNLMPLLVWDITRALEEHSQPAPEFPLAQLELYPTPEVFHAWCEEALRESRFLVHDIETAYSRVHDEDDDEQDSSYGITRFSLARSDERAITAPYQEPFVQILKDFLQRSRMDRVGWNSDEFDDPREAWNGWSMLGCRIDARWLWHFLQPTLPQSLACVSTFYTRVPEWKSFGSSRGTDDELYSCMDSWATAQDYLGIVKALRARRLK